MLSVLTGDIVESGALDRHRLQELQSQLEVAADRVSAHTCFELFSGDSWQTTCRPGRLCLTLAVAIQSQLRGKMGLETRISAGIGDYDFLVPEKISLSQGEAFTLSGRGVEKIAGERRLGIALGQRVPSATRQSLEAAIALLDGTACRWTEKQAQAVSLALSGQSQKAIASKFEPPISSQACGKRLTGAQWPLLREALDSLSGCLEELGSDEKTPIAPPRSGQ